jgi:hypothetical protein
MKYKIKIEIGAVLHKDGKIIKILPWKRARSLLKQFVQLLAIQLQQSGLTVKDTANADQAYVAIASNLAVDGGAAATTKGIVVGTGTGAVAMTDYKLGTQVTTNVTHAAVSFAVENPDTATWRVAISRVFTNATGASLGIREVGLYHLAAVAPVGPYCLDRTLYSVDVPNGVAVTMTYRISLSL